MLQRNGQLARVLVALAAVVIVGAGLRAASTIAVPILLAGFIAFISAPLVFRLHAAKVPYRLSVTVVLAAILGMLSTLGLVVAGTITRFRERLPDYRTRLVELTEQAIAWAAQAGLPVSRTETGDLFDTGSVMDLVGATVSGVGAVVSRTVLILLVVAFLLFDARRLWDKIDTHFGGEGRPHPLSKISDELYRYLGVKTGTSAATGLLLGTWCAVLRVDFALLWGFIAFVLNYIPTVGSIVAAIPPTIVALVMLGPGAALLVAAGYLVVNTLIGSILEPRLLGDAVGLSPATVLLSLVAWGWVLGPVGAILSVPLTMVVKVVLANTAELAWVAHLMSAERAPPPRASAPPPPSAEDGGAEESTEG